MSYILDALKRSEQERQQDKMPSFTAESMIFQTNQKKSHWWPYALILILIINVLALVFFNRDFFTEESLQSSQNENSKSSSLKLEEKPTPKPLSTSTVRPIPQTFVDRNRPPPANVVKKREYIQPIKTFQKESLPAENDNARGDDHLYGTTVDEGLLIKPKAKKSKYGDTVPIQKELAGTSNTSEKQTAQVDEFTSLKELESGVIIRPRNKKQESEPKKISSSLSSNHFNNTPLLTDLDQNFQKNIPDLAFNSHIYSDNPSQRRVMINNFYLKEGQSFDGLQLLEIGESFIKVSKGQTEFKLPVLRDWSGS